MEEDKKRGRSRKVQENEKGRQKGGTRSEEERKRRKDLT